MRAVEIDTASGRIVSRWEGWDTPPVYPRGRQGIAVADGGPWPEGPQRWTGTVFKPVVETPADDPVVDQLWRIETKLDALLSKP